MPKYLKLWFYYSKELFYYSYSIIFRNAWFLFIVYLLTALVLYSAKAKWIDYIGAIAIEYYIWYVFVTELAMMNRRDEDLVAGVQSGDIIILLNKPIHFIWMQLSKGFFRVLLRMTVIVIVSIWLVYRWAGGFPWFWFYSFFLFIFSFLIGILLLALVAILMGMFSFAFEDARFISFLLSKIYFIFGGVFFPLDIYPVWLQNIAKFLPFQYYIYSPARFFVTWDMKFFWSYFPIQILWLMGMILLVLWSYEKLVRRLEVNGG